MVDFLLVFIFSFFVRSFPVRKARPDFDSWGHLYLSHEVKRQKASPWGKIILKCWNSDSYMLPYFWHWIVGFFNINFIISISNKINSFLDAVFACLLYAALFYYFKDPYLAFVGLLLYLFTPMWFSSISHGTRISSFTPRLSSEILINLILILNFLELDLPLWITNCLTVVLMVSVLISTKFGLQALFFLTILISFLSGKFELFFLLLGSISILYILSGKAFFEMLTYQLTHLKEYYINNRDYPNSVTNRNKFRNIIVRSNDGKINYSKSLWELIATNSFTSVILKMPLFVVCIVLLLGSALNKDILVSQSLFIVCLSGIVLFLVINIPRLLFLGEAERYLNHISSFLIIFLISALENYNLQYLSWGLITYGMIYWILESLLVQKLSNKNQREEADQVVEDYLNKKDSQRLVASFPYHNFCIWRIMLNTQHNVIFPVHIKEDVRVKFINTYEKRYSILDLDKLNDLNQLTGLDLLILDKGALKQEGLEKWVPPSSWEKVSLEQSLYDIYELNR